MRAARVRFVGASAVNNYADMKIRKALTYDPHTGVIRRMKDSSVAMMVDADGYLTVSVYGTQYRAHRVAWFLEYGEWPVLHIDHINRVRFDNRIQNLRLVTVSENVRNREGLSPDRIKCQRDAATAFVALLKNEGMVDYEAATKRLNF